MNVLKEINFYFHFISFDTNFLFFLHFLSRFVFEFVTYFWLKYFFMKVVEEWKIMAVHCLFGFVLFFFFLLIYVRIGFDFELLFQIKVVCMLWSVLELTCYLQQSRYFMRFYFLSLFFVLPLRARLSWLVIAFNKHYTTKYLCMYVCLCAYKRAKTTKVLFFVKKKKRNKKQSVVRSIAASMINPILHLQRSLPNNKNTNSSKNETQ